MDSFSQKTTLEVQKLTSEHKNPLTQTTGHGLASEAQNESKANNSNKKKNNLSFSGLTLAVLQQVLGLLRSLVSAGEGGGVGQ